MASTAGQPTEAELRAALDARTRDVRAGGADRDPIADMRWALGTEPPDFLALVALVQRVGRPVVDVVEEQSLRTPLHIAALYAKVAYAAMLVSRGADIEAKDMSDWTPLMSAAFGESRSPRGGVAVARMLLSCGADVGACCKAGSTSLHIVASYGTVALGQLLLDRGADIDRRDSLDETPLHKAALRGDMPMVRFLAETGADLTLRAKCGSTPADFAAGESDASSEHAAIAEYLARAPAP